MKIDKEAMQMLWHCTCKWKVRLDWALSNVKQPFINSCRRAIYECTVILNYLHHCQKRIQIFNNGGNVDKKRWMNERCDSYVVPESAYDKNDGN